MVALVLEQAQLTAGRQQIWTFTAQDREEAIDTVTDTRRAIDLLVARADVDATRVGYYGFSYGAWLGTISAAVDKRLSLTFSAQAARRSSARSRARRGARSRPSTRS